MRCTLPHADHPHSPGAFTLLEVMAAMALFVSILAVVFSVFDLSTKTIRQANAKLDAFQVARVAFDAMTSRLQHATLSPYVDYYDSAGNPFRQSAASANFVPAKYGRYSDLHFICGPSSSLIPTLPANLVETSTHAVFFAERTNIIEDVEHSNLTELLGASGFLAAFGSDQPYRPGFIGRNRYRWRLYQVTPAAESLEVMKSAAGLNWFTAPVADGTLHPVAENVIALVIWPRLPTGEDPEGDALTVDYSYDSRKAWKDPSLPQPVQSHQLPSALAVTMAVLDEGTAETWAHEAVPPTQVDSALAGLFQNVNGAADDIFQLEQRLTGARANYRIFSSTIGLRESKWSD